MLKAFVHGKVPSELENREDILTSNVFGTLNYLSNGSLICSLLRNSLNVNNQTLHIEGENPHVRMWFWPRLERSEPDLLLSLKTDSQTYLFLIEVKYFSGKSGEDPEGIEAENILNQKFYDQLAREYWDLHSGSLYEKIGTEYKTAKKALIYLTLNHVFPKKDIENSLRTIREKTDFQNPKLYWLSWLTFHNEMSVWSPSSGGDSRIKEDLLRYLERKGIKSFGGFQLVDEELLNWKFHSQAILIPEKSYFSGLKDVQKMGAFYNREVMIYGNI
ncbi:hypothetical protein DRW41_10410 [Neobacillus piezotolerans]|uniref:Uncharacterized protein n=1 Tax=Neobacillus piezotolerans TaxID=2259171 RepID=A0A3D8GS97_9BACI|nr:hypothetical protein [Neobacillus piezotolerans]RDU37089.1 hypothetical protein DRW41_10410 [Neobacillus piezotolerans]